jgi:hypothetical protein
MLLVICAVIYNSPPGNSHVKIGSNTANISVSLKIATCNKLQARYCISDLFRSEHEGVSYLQEAINSATMSLEPPPQLVYLTLYV